MYPWWLPHLAKQTDRIQCVGGGCLIWEIAEHLAFKQTDQIQCVGGGCLIREIAEHRINGARRVSWVDEV
jgi:hypothetical protein